MTGSHSHFAHTPVGRIAVERLGITFAPSSQHQASGIDDNIGCIKRLRSVEHVKHITQPENDGQDPCLLNLQNISMRSGGDNRRISLCFYRFTNLITLHDISSSRQRFFSTLINGLIVPNRVLHPLGRYLFGSPQSIRTIPRMYS